MLAFFVWIKSWLQSKECQDLVEYALIAGLIALVCVLAITVAGQQVSIIWSAISTALTNAVKAGA